MGRIAARPPRLITAEDAIDYLSLPNRKALEAVPVRPLRIGARPRWDVRALDAWLDEQSNLSAESATGAEIKGTEDPEAAFAGWRAERG